MQVEETFPDVFVVRGQTPMGPGMVINSARLDTDGERWLRSLGTVTHLIMRLGTGHGLDDSWFIDRFHPQTWAMPRMSTRAGGPAQHIIRDDGPLPVAGSAFTFHTGRADEAALLLPQAGGVLVTCDALQAWHNTAGCSPLGGLVARAMGFLGAPLVIGPFWLKHVSGGAPQTMRSDFVRLAALPFRHLISGHGAPLKDVAHEAVQAAVERVFPQATAA